MIRTQHLCWDKLLPIPDLDPITGYLPHGDHEATEAELEARFGTNFARREMLKSLKTVTNFLWAQMVDEIWVDGSFCSEKKRPGDIDVIYLPPTGVDTATWGLYSPLRMDDLEDLLKIHLWPHPSMQFVKGKWVTLHDFFATDRSDVPKGFVHIKREART